MSSPLHENHGSYPLPEQPVFPAMQRDWRMMTRTIAHYERIEQIGEGTYGQVYKARCKDTNQIVAMKKIRVHHGDYFGMPPTVIREIKILKRLRHPNLVRMVEVVSSKGVEYLDEEDEVEEKHKPNASKKDRVVDVREGFKGNLFLVLEYVSHDLTGLMDVAYRFSEVEIKSIFKQLLEALEYMHDNKYVHRDIKSSNILIDQNFRVKLADFGLARCIEPPILDKIHDRGSSQEFTNKVITLWYRPPELLLGSTRYGTAVDIWSAGCILAELILGKPLFTGKDEMDQLKLIFDMMGTPTLETWEGYQDLKLIRTGDVKIEKERQPRLRTKYSSKIPAPALNLVEKLLELDPLKRLTASRALNSRYFLTDPRAPDHPEELGQIQLEGGHFHEFQTKKKRREAKGIAETAKQTALDMGRSEKEAQEEFDTTYKGIMEKVAREGLQVETKHKQPTKTESRQSQEDTDATDKRDRKESRRSSREKDRESRKEKSKRKDEQRRESGERDKARTDDERRRKRHRSTSVSQREETGKKGDDEVGAETEEIHGTETAPPMITEVRSEPRTADGSAIDVEVKGSEPRPPDAQASPQRIEVGRVANNGRKTKHRSRDRLHDRHRSDRDDRSHRDGHRRKGRETGRSRNRDKDQRHGEDRDERRSRHRDHGEPGGMEGRRDFGWDRGERGMRGPPPQGRGDFVPRGDDFGPGPYGPPRGGPPIDDYRRGGPPQGGDMGAYGHARGDYRDAPSGGQGMPPGFYDDRRRDRDRSPRRDRRTSRDRR